MNTITIELCKEDRERLDRIIAGLEHTHNCDRCVSTAVSLMAAGATPEAAEIAAVTEAAAPVEPEPVKEEGAEPAPEITATKADVQRKVVELSAAGKKAEVREIVTAYAANVSGIPDDKVNEVWQKLTALEG